MIQTVQSAFDFSAEDLRANQRGELSGRQLKRLRSARGIALVPLLLITGLVVIGGGTILFAAVLLLLTNVGEAQQGGRSLLVIACVAAPAIGVGLLIGFRWLMRRYLRTNRIALHSGRFKLYADESIVAGNSLVIKGQTFTLNKLQTTALRPYRQQQINLFYLVDSHRILSIDVLL